MKLLPPPGPDRRRLVLLVVLLVLGAAAYAKWGGSEPLPYPQTTGPAPTSNLAVAQPRGTVTGRAAQRTDPLMPQALKLPEMERIPDEPEVGRNLFRFGVRPAPPPPKPIATPTPVYTPPPDPGPPPIPPIPLKLTFVVEDPYQPGKKRAYLVEPKTGAVFEAFEGQIVDGKYRLLKVGDNTAVMSYLDGTGQRTLMIGR